MAITKRQSAYIMSIQDVLLFTTESKQDAVLPRVNVMGIIVSIDIDEHLASLVIDDGNASILVRLFEKNEQLHELKIGNVAKIIGFPRRLNEEVYLVPEIIKKLDKHTWLEYRHLELKILKPLYFSFQEKYPQEYIPQEDKIKEEEITIQKNNTDEPSEEIIDDVQPQKQESLLDTVIEAINSFDSGKGAAIEDIISKVKHADCERMIQKLIEQGEIFEVKPGRVKVL